MYVYELLFGLLIKHFFDVCQHWGLIQLEIVYLLPIFEPKHALVMQESQLV